MILAVLATLGATVVAFVLYPVFREARGDSIASPGDAEREIADLEEKKNRLYEAITDLDFEKEAGKVSESDYQTARDDYMSQVASVLQRIDALAPRKGEKKKSKRQPEEPAALRCESCSEPNPASAKFCIHCGAAFETPDIKCAGCGEKLPKEARFCSACGQKVTA